jgi:hypothetical protein
MKYKMVSETFGTFVDGDNKIDMRKAASADDNYINIDRGNGKPASTEAAATTNHVLPSTFFMFLTLTHGNTKENTTTVAMYKPE